MVVKYRPMAAQRYDLVFVGGGLAALLLLKEMLPVLPERVAVVDPVPVPKRPSVHWSYWSRVETFFDRFATGAWRRARVSEAPPEPIAPFTLRLVRSRDVLAHLETLLEASSVEWLPTTARGISRRSDDAYEVATDSGTVRARWVFDSAAGVPPVFPSPREPRAVLSGTGLRVTADEPAFDPEVATLFDPLDEASFAYLLPLSPREALIESASFAPVARKEDRTPLLEYLRRRYPRARFAVAHAEWGEIPLGFAPWQTSGPRHVLIGAKRGLVKPSAGYGVVRIAGESERLARLWKENKPLPPVRRAPRRWRFLDKGFLRLAARDPRLPRTLLRDVMGGVPIAASLRFIDEELLPRELPPLLRSALPAMLRRP